MSLNRLHERLIALRADQSLCVVVSDEDIVVKRVSYIEGERARPTAGVL